MEDRLTILQGDWVEQLKTLPDESVQMCCTSPPYFNQRNYGVDGQLGLEKTPDEYISKLVGGLREVRRVLRNDGVMFLNLGDSYASSGSGGHGATGGLDKSTLNGALPPIGENPVERTVPSGMKPKDLIGVPWMAAFALRSDGWYLRSEITWCKKVPMPESVRDRPTSATEKIFLLTKSAKYFYDADAVRNPPSEAWANDKGWKTGSTDGNMKNGYDEDGAQNPKKLHRMFDKQRGHSRRHAGFNDRWDQMPKQEQMAFGSNMRNFWLLGPEPFNGWVESVSWNRVEVGAVSDGMKCIVSQDSPFDGGLFDLISTVLDDEHSDAPLNHILNICDRLSLKPKDGFVPIGMLRAYCFGGESLDSLLLNNWPSAISRSTEIHKMGLFVSTTLSYKPSSERTSRIARILASRGFSSHYLDMLSNNIWPDEMDAHSQVETISRIADNSSFSCGAVYKIKKTKQSHFATFPTAVPRKCILAGSRYGDVVLDPFGGAFTTCMVALDLGRRTIGIELNPKYIEIGKRRCSNVTPDLQL